jgi:hypothetical protein
MSRRVEDLWLYGRDTTEMIILGEGYRDWPLLSFGGNVLGASRFGGPERRAFYLSLELLTVLYKRFADANPSGTAIVDSEEVDALSFALGTPQDERERLYEAGEVQCDVFGFRKPRGRDLIRHYLPELYLPEVLASLLANPALDPLRKNPNRPVGDLAYWSEDKHYRWSAWFAKT